jgi:Ca2+/H+ antiporter
VSNDGLHIVACADRACSTHTHMYDDADVAPSRKYKPRSISSSSVDVSTVEAEGERPPIVQGTIAAAAHEQETPNISLLATAVLLGAVTTLVAVTSEFLVGSIDGLSTKSGTPP